LICSAFCGLIAILAICIGLPFGPVGVATAWSLSGLLIGLPFYFHTVGRRGPVHTKDLWLGFVSHLPVWCAAFSSASVMRFQISARSPAMQLLIAVPVGLSAGIVTICL
jgi:PST family polysaccharide transporter